MNTSLSWIKAYVPELDVTAQEYTDAMTSVSYTHLEEKQELSDNPLIRVVLMTNGYQGIIHKEVRLRADSELTLTYGNRTEQIAAGECVVIAADDARLSEGKDVYKRQL